jgi:hypothetical protein
MGNKKPYVVVYAIWDSTVRVCKLVTVIRFFPIVLANLPSNVWHTRNDDTPVKPQRSLSVSEATKAVISLERPLNVPELTSNESLSVQIETVRLSGQTAISWVEKLLAMVTNLTAEVSQLKTDNAVLKDQMCELQYLLSAKSCHMNAAAGTSSSKPAGMSYNDAVASNQHQQARSTNASKSSRTPFGSNRKPSAANAVAEVHTTAKIDSAGLTALPGNPTEDGFITVAKNSPGFHYKVQIPSLVFSHFITFGKRITFIDDRRKAKNEYYYSTFSHYRKLVKITIKSDRHNWYKSIDDDLKIQPSKFWRYVSSVRKHNSYAIHLDVGTIVVEPTEVAEAFAKHFQSVYKPTTRAGPPLVYCPVTFLHLPPVSELDILKFTTRLRPTKSVGPDGIPSFIVKGCSIIFAPLLKYIFYLSL